MGQDYGLAIVAEGVLERLDSAELKERFANSVMLDSHGHLRLEEIPLATALRRHVQSRVEARKRNVRITDVTLGYTLRCAAPVPFDIDYTRTLGYGAARFLVSAPAGPALAEGGLVCQVENRIQVIPFRDLVDPRQLTALAELAGVGPGVCAQLYGASVTDRAPESVHEDCEK